MVHPLLVAGLQQKKGLVQVRHGFKGCHTGSEGLTGCLVKVVQPGALRMHCAPQEAVHCESAMAVLGHTLLGFFSKHIQQRRKHIHFIGFYKNEGLVNKIMWYTGSLIGQGTRKLKTCP